MVEFGSQTSHASNEVGNRTFLTRRQRGFSELAVFLEQNLESGKFCLNTGICC